MSARAAPLPFWLVGLPLFALFLLPALALLVTAPGAELGRALTDNGFLQALRLSLTSTAFTLGLMVLTGTPLAWWLAHGPSLFTRVARSVVDVPIVLPPAVVGLALLLTFSPQAPLGAALDGWGLRVAFTTAAVVLAQLTVAGPFYVHAARAAFAAVDEDTLLVARTLGCTPLAAFWRVALPAAAPALISGAGLAAARALGEFGATLLFAGNLPGVTQTMPLAVYFALESDLDVALALAATLALVSLGLLGVSRFVVGRALGVREDSA